ncbi:hypothetical protein AB0M43_35520 [Longispora sp. NPDC051575]|uniref:hypothetical protein n=1 Tax=Longispora sp. NPDC051575 TaxID=3154943 RepID=UPI0034193F93
MRHRNPYVILGIPFGSSREQANIAFARKARPLRRAGPAGREQMTDLTWALNQIDEGLTQPAAAMAIYRIPADPNVFATTGGGVFAPVAEPMPRRSPDSRAAFDQLREAAAHEYLRYLVLLRGSEVAPPAP